MSAAQAVRRPTRPSASTRDVPARSIAERVAESGLVVEGSTVRVTRPAAPARQSDKRPTLEVVRSIAPARATLPFLLLVVTILAAALVTSMVLNARMAQTAFEMQTMREKLNVINDHIDTVSTQVEDQAAPDHLAQRATELGMVPAGVPGVVDLGAGQVVGGAPAGQDGEQPR